MAPIDPPMPLWYNIRRIDPGTIIDVVYADVEALRDGNIGLTKSSDSKTDSKTDSQTFDPH